MTIPSYAEPVPAPKPKPGVGAYAKFWTALGSALTALIVAISDGKFTPAEISAIGPMFVGAALVFIVRNDNASGPSGTVRPDPARA